MYRKKWGPFNPMLRFDSAIARLYVSQFQGKPPNTRKMEHMMPWPIEEQQEATMEDVAMLLNGIAKAGKKNG